MTYHESDQERIKQAEELSARLNGVKIVHKVSKPRKSIKNEKWNQESELSRARLIEKFRVKQ